MPQVIKVGGYIIFFWLDEGRPLEPIHVHIAKRTPYANATKIWITKSGKAIVATKKSDVPPSDLRKLIRIVEANVDLIQTKWLEYFDTINYYC